MTFLAYLRSSVSAVALFGGSLALAAFMLAVGGVSRELLCLVVGIMLAGGLTALVVGYRRRAPFFSDLSACAEGEGNPLWTAALIEEPDCLEGEIALDALRAVSKAANDETAAARRQVADYREYVETWVHEAKSPLAAARLMLDNMREGDAGAPGRSGTPEAPGGPVDPAARAPLAPERAVALDAELTRVEGYIDQALFYARSETLDRDYLIRPHTLSDLVGEALRANAVALIGAHLVPVRTGLDLTVLTDEKWMAFILGQLIQNSVKYAREGGGELRFEGALRDEGLATERVELTVRDSGRGVPAADLPRVFDRGFTGESGRTGKRATGIGLYLVRRLCGKMGLSVRAASEEGAWFAVTIGFSTNKMHYFE